MASLRRLTNSPYWIACFTLPDGRRTQRSTGTTDKRSALKIADKFDDATRQARAGKLTESRARKTIADIYALANADTLPSSKINVFFADWLRRKEIEAGPKTHQRYSAVIERFLRFLGPRSNKDIAHLTSKEIAAFRDELSKQLTIGTVNISVKIIRAALAQARRDGLVDVNEGERVTLLKRTTRFERRPFTLQQLKRIIEVATDEWRGMILCGLYTGQRLGDIAGLCWNNVDLAQRELRFVTGKTGRRQIIPIHQRFADYLEDHLPTSDDPSAPLFPRTYSTRQRNISTGTLSNQFYRILVSAGLAEPRTHKSTGKGRSSKREQNELSFHCLRHTTTSLMKNAGISPAIVQEFIGHDSATVSRHYTHIDTEAMRKAANALPDLLGSH